MWLGHPLCTTVQTGAHRKYLRSHKLGVVPASCCCPLDPVLFDPSQWKRPGKEMDTWQQHVQGGECSAGVVSQMLQCQHLVISISSGTACSWDAVAVSTCYLSPAYCWHSDFSLHLFLGMNGMICHRSELQMLRCGFTSPGRWQT